jgi:hypothetical protein
MNDKEERVFLVLGTIVVTVIVWLAIVFSIGGCALQNNFDRYNVNVAAYPATHYLEDDIEATTSILVSLGFEIESVTGTSVSTEWERYYLGVSVRFATEVVARIVVDRYRGVIKGQCAQRKVDGPWYFKKCSNLHILERINQAVEQLQLRLTGVTKGTYEQVQAE